MKTLTIDIQAEYVACYNHPKIGVVILLPVLPPLTDISSSEYRAYLNAFEHVVCQKSSLDEDGFMGIFQVHHAFGIYQCAMLTPILKALVHRKHIRIIPYCTKEGFHDGIMGFVDLEVWDYYDGRLDALTIDNSDVMIKDVVNAD